ncbi:hypothetical protein [Natrononativus amylolyticus]|uniref:hypothetical protein n=1 Tax=Natrononativus amylolyticus TaxID=2963434 RepID=UPI0020CF03DA|nr:hypothetical protein [Natrononativus amylolyticus]
MNQQQFVQLAILAFCLVIASFVVLGTSRLLFGYRTAQLLAAPVGLLGFGLVVFLFLRATGAALGVAPIEE